MTIYAPSGSGVHLDVALTNISVAWSNEAMIGDQLFPTVGVRRQSDKYYTFGREAWLPESGDFRAPGSEANEIPGLTVSTDTYYAQEHALQIAVADEERENTDSPMSPDRDGTELVTSKIMLGREKAMHDLVVDNTQYATSMTTTLSGTSQWNDYTNSDPIVNFKTGRHNMHALCFMEPNTYVVPYQVMSQLEDHPDFLARIQYTDRGILTPELIAAVLSISNATLLVPGIGIATDSTLVPGYLWGKDVLMAWVPPRAGLRIPAFAYEFVWSLGGAPMAVDRWREEKRVSDLLRVRRRYDLKLVGKENNAASTNNGKVITGYLIKAAVA